ncbi:MAG TPA: SDR family NAD(P)-dependent oxidoreductase, partial [Gammaproteobacteria bacterium]
MDDFRGKVAFITGGGSGVGLGQAQVFGKAGCRVVIADIRRDHLDHGLKTLKDQKIECHGVLLDITDRDAYARAADEVERVFAPAQLLFNTAGVSIFGPMEKSTYSDWDWQLGVNLGGVVNGIQTFVPRMIKYGKGGHIVNTASLGGFLSSTFAGIYCTAKFAVVGLSD